MIHITNNLLSKNEEKFLKEVKNKVRMDIDDIIKKNIKKKLHQLCH